MRPEVITLLAKAFSQMAREARPDLEPGEHDIDEMVTLHALGGMKVGDNYRQRIANKARPWKLVVALLDMLNGVSIEAVVKRAEGILPEREKEVRRAAEKAAERLKDATWTDCHGKVTIQGPTATQISTEAVIARRLVLDPMSLLNQLRGPFPCKNGMLDDLTEDETILKETVR